MTTAKEKEGTSHSGDLPPAVFRDQLHRVADWIADYRENIERYRVTPEVEPGHLVRALASAAPAQGAPVAALLDEFERLILPGIVHWGHPSFLGYFATATNGPGILGEMIAAALNLNAMTWRTSPAATELEQVVLDWLRQMLGLPSSFTGVIYDTASVSTMHALAAAREAAGYDLRRRGFGGRSDVPPLTVYASDQAHSSVEKAAITIGLGEENVRRIESDADYRMDFAALARAVAEDIARGVRPLAIVATVGTTSTASVDPVPQIAALCREHDIWLHVDAAYGGAMGLVPEGRWAMAGAGEADSLVVNPHKWLFVPIDFSALYTRRPEMLRAVFSLTPEYLRGDAEGAEINYMDYGLALGRRFRALKAWMVFRAFGTEGMAARLSEQLRLARLFASWVEAAPNFELLAPVTMGVVCFRALPSNGAETNQFNEQLSERINATGEVYLTRTVLRGRIALRLGTGNILTEERHLRACWELIRRETAG